MGGLDRLDDKRTERYGNRDPEKGDQGLWTEPYLLPKE